MTPDRPGRGPLDPPGVLDLGEPGRREASDPQPARVSPLRARRDSLAPLDDDIAGEHTSKIVRPRHAPAVVQVPTLQVAAGKDLLRHVVLDAPGEYVIGRDEGTCRLVLTDPSVSRKHAKVVLGVDGSAILHDLDSTNGTTVDGVRVSRHLLARGDRIEIGAVPLRFDLLREEEVEHLRRVVDAIAAANRDPLTGLYTRAFLDHQISDLLTAAERAGAHLAALLLDLDHFKAVNDRYGHRVGDDVLSTVARIVLYSIRETDAAIRYGGEEFLIVLYGGLTSANEVAERLRREIQGHDWGRTAAGLEVTTSLGVSTWRPGEDVPSWIERADRALYRAKHAGRNNVVVEESAAGADPGRRA